MVGSPSPTGTVDPFQHNEALKSYLLDPAVGPSVGANRACVVGTPGTLQIRRHITNTSSTRTISAAKLRITALSEVDGLARPGTQPVRTARLRAVDPATSTSLVLVTGRSAVIVRNLAVDGPSTSTVGGGLNSTMTVTLPQGGLAPGASLDVAFTFAVDTRGTFWMGYDIDALDTSVAPLSARSAETEHVRPFAGSRRLRAKALSTGRL